MTTPNKRAKLQASDAMGDLPTSKSSTAVCQRGAREDPCLRLNDECMVHLFSFLGGPTKRVDRTGDDQDAPEVDTTSESDQNLNNTDADVQAEDEAEASPSDGRGSVYYDPSLVDVGPFWSAKEAGRFYNKLVLVSKRWRQIVDKSIAQLISMPLDFDMDNLNFPTLEDIEACMSWLCHHKLSLGSLDCGGFGIQWCFVYPRWQQLFRECDTSELASLSIPILVSAPFRPNTSLPVVSNFSDEIKQQLNSMTPETLNDMNMQMQIDMQDEIAEQCPKVQKFMLHLSLDDQDVGGKHVLAHGISRKLFSLPSIVHLTIELHLDGSSHAPNINVLLTNLVKNMTGLKLLVLSCDSQSFQGTIEIESTSLKTLYVATFTEGASFSLKCPSLTAFFFKCSDRLFQKIAHAENLREDCLGVAIDHGTGDNQLIQLASVVGL